MKSLLLFLPFIGLLPLENFATPVNRFCEDFESGSGKWHFSVGSESAHSISDHAAGGKASLLLSGKSQVWSEDIRLEAKQRYELCVDSFSEVAARFSVHLVAYDKVGNKLNFPTVNSSAENLWHAKKKNRKFWFTMTIPFDTTQECDRVKILIDKWSNDKVWIDNVRIVSIASRPMLPADPLVPVKSQVTDSRALTLPGPDGVLYPNWTWAGSHDQPSKRLPVYFVDDFGAVPDDEKDDTPAIEAAIDKAANHGGVIQLGKGVYRLTR